MGSFSKGDIIIFPFPYTDLTDRKVRPSLVISDEMDEDLILCQITSKNTKKDDFSVELKKNETLKGSLSIDSFIRSNMIFTADKKQIIKKVCKIKDKKYKEVVSKICDIIS